MDPISLTPREYYWNQIYPRPQYMRDNFNIDFGEHEQRRIKEISAWRKEFTKKLDGQAIEKEASFYVTPVEKISPTWEAALLGKGNFLCIGLSALQNNPSVIVMALIRREDSKKPDYHKLINITKSKKIDINNKRNGVDEPFLLVESWDYINSDKIYQGVSLEKNYFKNLISETLSVEDNIAASLQMPLISSPGSIGSVGGITLSSFTSSSKFSRELVKTFIQMNPPEYRNIPPPARDYEGVSFEYLPGIRLRFADRPYSTNSVMEGLPDTSYVALYEKLSKRENSLGEHSIFSNINTRFGTSISNEWSDLVKRFTSTEITVPKELDEINEYGFANLNKLIESLNVSMWSKIVYAHNLAPSFKNEDKDALNKVVLRLRADFDAHLSEIHKDEDIRKNVIDSMLGQRFQLKIMNLTSGFARVDNGGKISESHFSKSRDLTLDNFVGFMKHERVERLLHWVIKKKENKEYSVIRETITNNPGLNAQEIFNIVKNYGVPDLYKTCEWLDWMHKKGLVLYNADKRYFWLP